MIASGNDKRGRSWKGSGVVGGLIFAAIYITLALLTLRAGALSLPPDLYQIIWLPSGVALAFIVQAGIGAWPWIFFAEMLVTVITGDSLLGAVGTGTGSVVEAVLAAWLLRRFGFSPSLTRWRDVVALIGLGAGLSSLLGAMISVGFLAVSGSLIWSSVPVIGLRWWLTHSQGIILLTPVVLTLSGGSRTPLVHRPMEAALVLVGLLLSAFLLFGSASLPLGSEVLLYAPVPILLLAAFRLGLSGAALANLVLVVPALLATASGRGPLVGLSPTWTVIQVGGFVAVCVLTSLVVAGVVEERELVAEARLRAEEERRALSEQMHQTQKLESLGVLAGGIAHDFNNLLVSIMGNADLAERRLDRDHPAGDHVSEVLRASRRAADLCRQILAYAGRGQVATGAVDLNEVVEEMGELLSVSFPRDAVVEMRLRPELPDVWGDVTQLRQVVLNLLTNAADALQDGRGHITVETGRLRRDEIVARDLVTDEMPSSGEEFVHFTVEDDGEGMDETMRSRVFEPFFTSKSVGRGLGLAVVLGIVRSHGGCLELRTAPGEGARFRMILPVARDQRKRVGPPAQALPPVAPRIQGRVLLVDDEDQVRQVARRMLEEMGLEVLEASDGEEAVELFRRHGEGIDGVLMDLSMPRMNGSLALAAIRDEDPTARVLLSTGNAQDLESMALDPEVSVLLKPYRSQELQSAVMELLYTETEVGG